MFPKLYDSNNIKYEDAFNKFYLAMQYESKYVKQDIVQEKNNDQHINKQYS